MIEITYTSSGRSIEIRQLNTAAASSMEHHAQTDPKKLRKTDQNREPSQALIPQEKFTSFLTYFVFMFNCSCIQRTGRNNSIVYGNHWKCTFVVPINLSI